MLHMHRFGFARRYQRLLRKGDFKYLILNLLKEKPHYGYEIIRTLEERFQGFYTPSPGIVYPTLEMLEEMGYAISSQQNGKKVYTITEGGRKFLDERAQVAGEIEGQLEKLWNPEIRNKLRETMQELWELGRLIRLQLRGANPEKLERIRSVISEAHKSIDTILRQDK